MEYKMKLFSGVSVSILLEVFLRITTNSISSVLQVNLNAVFFHFFNKVEKENQKDV